MIARIGFIFLLLISLSLKAAENSTTDTTRLYQKAQAGNAAAQLDYAKVIYPSSKKEAFKWAQKAADQGLAEAWYWMGINSSAKDANYYYTKAAKLGYAPAFSLLIDSYMLAGKDANFAKAKEFADLAQQKNILIGFNSDDAEEKRLTIQHCYEAGPPVIPVKDNPNDNEKKAFSPATDCDIYRFGLGTKQDYVKYRECLLAQKEIDNISLAEIYANGWGVSRDSKLALGLICYSGNLAPAELYDMVKTLYDTHRTKLPKNFVFCEHITSGYNMGVCAAREEKITKAKRANELEAITSEWPESHQIAFKKLQKAAQQFFSEHSTNEVDMSGTARAAIAIGEESTLHDDFIKSIKIFETGKLPSDNNFQEADKALNTIYTKLMAYKFSDQTGTLTKQGFINTQRTWLAYRDAWANFGALHYPGITADTWKTWVTKERTKQLNEIYKNL